PPYSHLDSWPLRLPGSRYRRSWAVNSPAFQIGTDATARSSWAKPQLCCPAGIFSSRPADRPDLQIYQVQFLELNDRGFGRCARLTTESPWAEYQPCAG